MVTEATKSSLDSLKGRRAGSELLVPLVFYIPSPNCGGEIALQRPLAFDIVSTAILENCPKHGGSYSSRPCGEA